MLSEEEKNAINNLNFIVVTDIYDNEVNINKTEIVNEYNHSVGIVLNLITNLQKENEELKATINKQSLDISNSLLELKQKDKQINLMADFMYKTGTGRKALSCVFRQNDECNENGCEYCIKRYFAGLVERK